MKSKLIICSIILLTMFSCNKKSFMVNMEINNANGKTVYLQKIINNETINIDSVVVKDNKAAFIVKTNDSNDAYHIFIKGWRRAVPFFADNKDVSLIGDFNAYHKINISASETQLLLNEFNKKINDLDDQSLKLFITDFVKNNSQKELCSYIIYRNKWAFNFDELKQLSMCFPEGFQSGYYQKLVDYIKILERTEVGQPYLDFTLNNIDGQPVKLSDIVKDNKLVMIDFWASWCPDCRVENPNVVLAYNNFKDKGLEIVSVSLDSDKKAWLKGIEEDKLSWDNHLSDLKGWNCAPATEYGVAFIPQNFLINNEGIIVGKNLDGDNLQRFINNYLND